MAVSLVLHAVPGQCIELVGAVIDDLPALLQRWGLPGDISATNQEKSIGFRLHVFKVVRKVFLHFDGALKKSLGLPVKLDYGP